MQVYFKVSSNVVRYEFKLEESDKLVFHKSCAWFDVEVDPR